MLAFTSAFSQSVAGISGGLLKFRGQKTNRGRQVYDVYLALIPGHTHANIKFGLSFYTRGQPFVTEERAIARPINGTAGPALEIPVTAQSGGFHFFIGSNYYFLKSPEKKALAPYILFGWGVTVLRSKLSYGGYDNNKYQVEDPEKKEYSTNLGWDTGAGLDFRIGRGKAFVELVGAFPLLNSDKEPDYRIRTSVCAKIGLAFRFGTYKE
jgi:hypothetical protein